MPCVSAFGTRFRLLWLTFAVTLAAGPAIGQPAETAKLLSGIRQSCGTGGMYVQVGLAHAAADVPRATAQQAAPLVLRAGNLTAKLSAEDGRILSLAVRGHEVLAAPGQLLLQVGTEAPVRLGEDFEGFAISQQESGVVMEGREPNSGVVVRVEWLAGDDLECRVRLVGQQKPRLEASVQLRLPTISRRLHVLAPSGEDHAMTDFSTSLALAYRGHGRGLVMPAVVLYRPEEDWGVTLFADFKLPTRGFELNVDSDSPAIAVRRVHLRLDPGEPVTESIILFGHEGDWRPGLARVVDRYPDFFVVADERVPKLHGAFVCSGGTPPDSTIADWKEQHVQTVEVHGTLPFYGQHLPLGKQWTAFADDQWHRLRQRPDPDKPAEHASWTVVHSYVSRKCPPNTSVAKINDYIRRLHGQGIYAIMYFNTTESWKLWVKENYPDDLVRTASGDYMPAWYESYLVCPNPDSPWGKHLLAEFEKMMDLYPEADGFFVDQSCYDNLDYAHDDGWSIQDGRTAYRMGWAINQLSQRCRQVAKDRGKFMWWNGPYNVDIARFAEGMMAEAGRESQVRSIQYLMMGGRACCTLSRQGEPTFQNCAAYGIYPTAMHTPELRRLASRYWPVFELFRGKRWVLTAHALTLPEGIKGNIYRLPDGNVLVTAVSPDRSVDGEAFELDTPLTVRLPDAAEFRAAYFISPDLLGKRCLALQREGEVLSVVVPRHRSVSAALLAKTGIHVALEGPFGVVTSQAIEPALVIDNWTDKPIAGKWTSPAWEEEPVCVEAGNSVRRGFPFQAPSERRGLREAVVCRAELAGQTYGGQFEFYTDEPLNVGMELPEELYQNRPAVARLWVFNATRARDVRVVLRGDGIRAESAQQTATIAARARHPFEFRVLPIHAGQVRVTAVAEAGDDRAEVESQPDVCATEAWSGALEEIRAATLVFDVFGSDAGKYKNKPVFINGVPIGILPTGGGDEWSRAEMVLPPATFEAIGERNELRVENTPGDAFKVRNFQLRLRLADGICLVSEVNGGVFTSCGWKFAEGTVFQHRQPLTGIDVHIPVKPGEPES